MGEHETPSHIEGSAITGQGRGAMETVTCSCGWSECSDAFHDRRVRHGRWTDHVIGVLLADLAQRAPSSEEANRGA